MIMASLIPFTPPLVYEMLRAQYHVALFKEPVHLDNDGSGYESGDDGSAQPSPVDPLDIGEGINGHDPSVWSSCQRHSGNSRFVRHVAPLTEPDRTYTKSGPVFVDGTCPHPHHHERKPYIPSILPSLSSHIQINTNNTSFKPPPQHRSPNRHPQPENPPITNFPLQNHRYTYTPPTTLRHSMYKTAITIHKPQNGKRYTRRLEHSKRQRTRQQDGGFVNTKQARPFTHRKQPPGPRENLNL